MHEEYILSSLFRSYRDPQHEELRTVSQRMTLHCEADSHKLLHRSGRISPTRSGTLMGTANRSIGYGKSLSTCIYPLCLERVFAQCLQVPSPVARERLCLPAEMPDHSLTRKSYEPSSCKRCEMALTGSLTEHYGKTWSPRFPKPLQCHDKLGS